MARLSPQASYILSGLLGALLLVAYFMIMSRQQYFTDHLDPRVPEAAILEDADRLLRDSPLGGAADLVRGCETQVDQKLLRFAQRHRGNARLHSLHDVVTVEVSYKGTIGADTRGEYVLTYDYLGELRRFRKAFAVLDDSTDLSPLEAEQLARDYLLSQGIDIGKARPIANTHDSKTRPVSHTFTFNRVTTLTDSLAENYEFEIRGATITAFSARLKDNEPVYQFPDSDTVSNIIFAITVGLTFFIIILSILGLFLRRLRNDRLEYRRGLIFSSLVCLIMWAGVIIEAWPDVLEGTIGGFFLGIFSGIGFLIIFIVTESVARDAWPEKLTVSDQLLRGRFFFRELGEALLRSLALGGIAMLVFAVAVWVADQWALTFLEVESEMLFDFRDATAPASLFAHNLTIALFVGTMFLCFPAIFLRTRVRNHFVVAAILLVIVLFGFTKLYILRPVWLGGVLLLPVAGIFTYAAYRFDLFTHIMTVFWAANLFDLSFLPISDTAFSSTTGVLFILMVGTALLAGTALVYSKQQIADFDEYIPDYQIRYIEQERMKRELEVARDIQTTFLPQSLPHFAGLEIASICIPAMEVGGDYYDFVSEDRDQLGVIIGDVSGKGVSAAFYMTMTKGVLKTLFRRTKSPAKVLAELNHVFFENSPRHVFISILYGLFDMPTRTLTFSRAGHNPLLVRKRQGGALEWMSPGGIAIGMDSGSVFSKVIQEQSVSFEPGDVFAFYTDGISEAMNRRGEEFGEERLGELIVAHSDKSATEIVDVIHKTVFEFAGNARQHDDFTMVLVKVT